MAIGKQRSIVAQRRRADIVNYVAYALVLLFFGLPLVWVLSLSLRTPEEIWEISTSLIPRQPVLDNFWTVLKDGNIQTYLLNSVKFVGLGVFCGFVGAAPAAYAMSRLRFRGSNPLLVGVLALQMISPVVIMIPLYRLLSDLHLTESQLITGLIYGALLMPFMTWVLKGFIDQIPVDLDEAAMIDGCSRRQAFIKVVLPVAAPGVASALILAVIVAWGQFAVPYILLKRNGDLPIAVGILSLQSQQQYVQSPLGLLAAATILAMAPVTALFLAMQRFVIQGLIRGALK